MIMEKEHCTFCEFLINVKSEISKLEGKPKSDEIDSFCANCKKLWNYCFESDIGDSKNETIKSDQNVEADKIISCDEDLTRSINNEIANNAENLETIELTSSDEDENDDFTRSSHNEIDQNNVRNKEKKIIKKRKRQDRTNNIKMLDGISLLSSDDDGSKFIDSKILTSKNSKELGNVKILPSLEENVSVSNALEEKSISSPKEKEIAKNQRSKKLISSRIKNKHIPIIKCVLCNKIFFFVSEVVNHLVKEHSHLEREPYIKTVHYFHRLTVEEKNKINNRVRVNTKVFQYLENHKLYYECNVCNKMIESFSEHSKHSRRHLKNRFEKNLYLSFAFKKFANNQNATEIEKPPKMLKKRLSLNVIEIVSDAEKEPLKKKSKKDLMQKKILKRIEKFPTQNIQGKFTSNLRLLESFNFKNVNLAKTFLNP